MAKRKVNVEKQPDEIKIGDYVKIIGYGFERANGTGNIADGRGWVRKVNDIVNANIYHLVNDFGKTTGYYPKESIEKE